MAPEPFAVVGSRPPAPLPARRRARPFAGGRAAYAAVLGAILLGCLLCPLLLPADPAYMDLTRCGAPPGLSFWFGTDTMGRDIFAMIWYGGRTSLFIGFVATGISTAAAILYGTVSGLAPVWLDNLLTRLAELLLSVPSLLLILLLQGIFEAATPASIAFVIGITSWTGIARVVRTQVRQLRESGFVAASRCMGGGFFHILRVHLAPNFLPSILFMVVMNIRGAIAAESTLSFMGMGLPLDTISWGSMLALSESALLGGAWWIVLIPGVFLAATLLCVTGLGDSLRGPSGRAHSNL